MKLKSSFYNEIIEINEISQYLIYNILNGGLFVLDYETGVFLDNLAEEERFSPKEHPEIITTLLELEQGGFLVPADKDEKADYQKTYANKQQRKYRNSSQIGLTIGTTILCNMGCPYCFQVEKPNKSLRNTDVIKGIAAYIEDMIHKAPVKHWKGLSVNWFGGEPLVNKEGIRGLTNELIALSEKYNIPYDAMIITNGILLDDETWNFLREHKIDSVQVTIDGAKEVHDEYRPLKNKNADNYEQILRNLSNMPDYFSAVIRINTDKRVAESFPRLLDDLQAYGVWPQRHKSVSLTLAWLKAYKGADVSKMINLTQEEFFEVQNQFSELKVNRFNQWRPHAEKAAKLKWRTPERQSDCATYVSPYVFTVDPQGDLHKCWETLHDEDQSSGAKVFQPYNPEDFEKYLNYARTNVHPVCYNCKFNPVCEGLSCAYDAIEGIEEDEFPCTPWKTELKSYFKKMYLRMMDQPEEVVLQENTSNEFQTHANK